MMQYIKALENRYCTVHIVHTNSINERIEIVSPTKMNILATNPTSINEKNISLKSIKFDQKQNRIV